MLSAETTFGASGPLANAHVYIVYITRFCRYSAVTWRMYLKRADFAKFLWPPSLTPCCVLSRWDLTGVESVKSPSFLVVVMTIPVHLSHCTLWMGWCISVPQYPQHCTEAMSRQKFQVCKHLSDLAAPRPLCSFPIAPRAARGAIGKEQRGRGPQ